ncbi:MAG: metalloregulator ArsR/SmtB family transcription factor [Candidatus Promineifilaceae bacterium]
MIATVNPTLDFLKLLAHDVRWALVAALAQSDRRVQELVEILQRPQNLVSYHLRLLREGQIVTERRSSADGRDVYYSLNLDQLRGLYQESGQSLHPALACAQPAPNASPWLANEGLVEGGGERPYRVLFLCTHNSARSQLAEGILRATGGNLVEVFSAGSEPDRVHPLAVRAAAALQIDISSQQSKHLDAFAGQTFDYVITVCDQVRESCPVFPDDPHQIHWSFSDPAAVVGSEADQFQAFLQTARELSTRINYLCLMLERQSKEN